ncbi:MAG TPA: ABC transporter permease [Gemmataceae bacterium]|nr:ABC transporter permease [Gemmataceae bacterium]
MPGQLATVWKFRHFWLSLAGMDLRVRYRRSALGLGWSLLNPVVMTVVFCVAFASWLGNGDWRTAAPYYLAGLVVWDFVKHSAVQGSLTLLRNEPYIRQSPLPAAVYTLRTSLGVNVHFLIALVVVIAASAVLNTDHLTPFYALWSVVPAVVLLSAFCWAVTALCAIANVFFHDTQHLAEVGFGICFFLTPIIYPKDRLTERGLGFVADANPVVAFLDVIRDPLLTGVPPTTLAFAKVVGISFVAVVATVAAFARFERRLVFHL